jgi:hypothetical protein
MNDKRKQVRKVANIVLEVTDHNTGASLGQIVNITTDGLLLISRETIAIDTVFQMDMHRTDPADTLSFGATALWSSPARQEGCFWTGFHIIDVSPEVLKSIDEMADDWQADSGSTED